MNVLQFMEENPNIILVTHYTNRYRVTAFVLGSRFEAFMAWAAKSPGVWIPDGITCDEGFEFEIKDQKTLRLCKTFLGAKIYKVEQYMTYEEALTDGRFDTV